MRICSGAGCLRSVANDIRFCDECAPEHARVALAKQGNERARNDAFLLEYSRPRWTKGVRPIALRRCPFCAVCKRKPSAVADHVIPARVVVDECRRLALFPFDSMAGFYIVDNLQGLCHSCHNRKTQTEERERKDWTDALGRLLARFVDNKAVR